MRYQERIYIQNDNRGVRNKDILNVNMSSDFCIFKNPTFDVSGATKVQCSDTQLVLSGYSFSDILSAATENCFGTGSTINYSSTTWTTKVYEDDVLKNEDDFYQTIILSGIPTELQLINSVKNSFNTLGYDYTSSGATFDVYKPYGVKDLAVDVCVSFNLIPLGCPVGFTAMTDGCEQIIVTGATNNGLGPVVTAGDVNLSYGMFGAYFWPDISTVGPLPVYISGGTMYNQTGGTVTVLNVNNSATFWGNPTLNTTDGRLNKIGISASTVEWVGFSQCINIETAGTYYVGLAADNFCKFTLNGELIVALTGGTTGLTENYNFTYWSVFPVNLLSGLNIIEMVGKNRSLASAFGAEIYNPSSYAVLTGATSTGITQANAIFSTLDKRGDRFDLGQTFGYTCPSGYALSTCNTGYTCNQIIKTGYTGTSGVCSDTCAIVGDTTFPYIDNNSNGIYVTSVTASTLPLTFNFTGNTDSFTGNNATFKYEIYKYLPSGDVFRVPPVYKSEIFDYSLFSSTNILTDNISIASLQLDGDYLIKGYFNADACTDFMKRLGKTIDTVAYKRTGIYSIYNPVSDYYFVAINEAEKPIIITTLDSGEASNVQFTLGQQVILVDFASEEADSDEGVLYTRTGSTFVLTNEYIGAVLLTLNGLTLAPNIDYTLSGDVLTFLGPISDGDIINVFYTRSSTQTLISENILVNTAIVSGTTNNQGTNKAYYNTTTGKYEIYTVNTPLQNTSILVMLNGITLSQGIDYYQSTSNPKRIILIGSLMIGDIITIIYYPAVTVINGITTKNNIISWYVQNAPQLLNGEFVLEYSTGDTFSTVVTSDIVPYEVGVTAYSGILTVSGSIGTKLYYRVKNIKNYASICGDIIQSVIYSDYIPIVIQSNETNSY